MTVAVALEKSNMGSLREIQHKDQYGNVISTPLLNSPSSPPLTDPCVLQPIPTGQTPPGPVSSDR